MYGYSQSSQISPIVSVIRAYRPRMVVDVGFGGGAYGFLTRHYARADGWADSFRLLGIEGYGPSVEDIHRHIYDEIIVGEARDVLANWNRGPVDMILLIDVIEHLPTREALELLESSRKVGGMVIVSTPMGFQHQHDDTNPFQEHRSGWTKGNLRRAGARVFVSNEYSLIGLVPSTSKGIEFCRGWQASERNRRAFALMRRSYRALPAPLQRFARGVASKLGARARVVH